MKKGIDFCWIRWYSIQALERVKQNMREWRNRQTRTFEGRVGQLVRVQVPSLAPYWVFIRDLPMNTQFFIFISNYVTHYDTFSFKLQRCQVGFFIKVLKSRKLLCYTVRAKQIRIVELAVSFSFLRIIIPFFCHVYICGKTANSTK